MYFDWRLWAMMAGLRLRVAGAVGLGLLAMGFGILRFVFLGRMLALAFRGAPIGAIGMAAAGTAVCILLRAALDHARDVMAQGTAGQMQVRLRARLFDRIAELGPAWFGAERTGGVMLSMVDGVEQLQTFFGAVPAAADHRRLRAGGDLRLAGVVGRADGRRHAGRRAVRRWRCRC